MPSKRQRPDLQEVAEKDRPPLGAQRLQRRDGLGLARPDRRAPPQRPRRRPRRDRRDPSAPGTRPAVRRTRVTPRAALRLSRQRVPSGRAPSARASRASRSVSGGRRSRYSVSKSVPGCSSPDAGQRPRSARWSAARGRSRRWRCRARAPAPRQARSPVCPAGSVSPGASPSRSTRTRSITAPGTPSRRVSACASGIGGSSSTSPRSG